MFSRQRKARVLFGLSDVVLTALAFEAAYQTRAVLHLERAFFLSPERKALVLGLLAGGLGGDRAVARQSMKSWMPGIRA